MFQSTHPRAGCDNITQKHIHSNGSFNPRTPGRGATPHVVEQLKTIMFQSTHPRAGCDWERYKTIQYLCGFNPRTPGRGATSSSASALRKFPVSIHAPPGGVRRYGKYTIVVSKSVSIHAPPGGVRLSLPILLYFVGCFNPRTPGRGATGTRQ